MGKPQSNFQYRTIFGVPLIAGNTLIGQKPERKIKSMMNKQKSFLKIKKRKPPVPWGGFRGLRSNRERCLVGCGTTKVQTKSGVTNPNEKIFQ